MAIFLGIFYSSILYQELHAAGEAAYLGSTVPVSYDLFGSSHSITVCAKVKAHLSFNWRVVVGCSLTSHLVTSGPRLTSVFIA
jgi:hypothetical protein